MDPLNLTLEEERPHSSLDPIADSGGVDGVEERQRSLDALDPVDPEQCEAYAASTGDRCQHAAMTPFPYCELHIDDLLDDVDLKRMGLKPSKTED